MLIEFKDYNDDSEIALLENTIINGKTDSCKLLHLIYNSVGKPYWSEVAIYHSLDSSSSLL